MKLAEARARVESLILSEGTHGDYTHCVEHATLCRKLSLGHTDGLLQQFSREEDADFAIRKLLTVALGPALWEELCKPLYTVSRLNGAQIDKRFDYPVELSDAERLRRQELLIDALDHYYDNGPQEAYLSKHVIRRLATTDPNAWVLTEFAPFDFRTERPRPYPVILPCEAVIDFSRFAGVVTSVTSRLKITRGEDAGWRYTTYLDNEALDYWPVLRQGTQLVSTLPEGSKAVATLTDEGGQATYELRILTHRAGKVPAIPVGYVPDEQTSGRTFVSPLNAALPFLLQELKTGSELQIVMSQVTHPHKAQFVNRCEGEPNRNDGRPWGCNNGLNSDLQPCAKCGGTTKSTIAHSAIDTLTVPLPKDITDLKVKLNEMVAFTAPPVEVPRLQIEYQDRLVSRAKQVVYGTDLLTKTTVAQTATERMAQLAQLNTALTPCADHFSAMWVHGALVTAGYLDVQQGLEPVYDFPPGLELAEVSDLELAYAEAVKAGMPAFMLEQRLKNIIRRQFANDPEELRKMLIKTRFIPFLGLSEDAVLKLATLGFCSAEERVLRTHADSIFTEIELAEPRFYDLIYTEQQKLVNAKAGEVLGRQGSAAISASPFRQLSINQPATAVA